LEIRILEGIGSNPQFAKEYEMITHQDTIYLGSDERKPQWFVNWPIKAAVFYNAGQPTGILEFNVSETALGLNLTYGEGFHALYKAVQEEAKRRGLSFVEPTPHANNKRAKELMREVHLDKV
jgi:hypothetical protein